jgi:nucleoside 2-deoxyribosyltransferase
MKLCVYLSGWSQELEYRKIAKNYCGDKLDLIDPMIITWPEVNEHIGENCNYVYVVQRDKKLILQSDILVAYIKRLSFGTIMEIMFAYDHGIPVYVVCDNDQFLDDPWLLFHSTKQFRKIEDCFDFIMGK